MNEDILDIVEPLDVVHDRPTCLGNKSLMESVSMGSDCGTVVDNVLRTDRDHPRPEVSHSCWV